MRPCERWALLGICAVAAACATQPSTGVQRATPAAPAAPAPDVAQQLAARLPMGADRCAVARPQRLGSAHRDLARRVVQTDALAWTPALQAQAFASAEHERADGPSARVMWLRSSLPLATLRAALDAQLAIDWTAEGRCTEPPCPLRGEVIDSDVRLTQGAWPQGLAPGAEAHCARAIRELRALEVSASRARRMPVDALVLPLRTTTSVFAGSDGLDVERVEIMVGRIEATERAQRARAEALRLAASALRVEQEDVLVRAQLAYLWEDLELLERDEALMRQADAAADARARAAPPPLTGPLEPHDYLAHAAQLLLGMSSASASEREQRAADAIAVLESGLQVHPEHESIALVLFDLYLEQPGSTGRANALELASRFDAMSGADPRWAELRTRAQARGDARSGR